jgi:superfamily I DNA/RNA helicase
MHALVETIREREFAGQSGLPCGYGYAVVFPDCRWTGTTPPGAERSIVLDSSDLPHLGGRIASLVRRWNRNPNPAPLEGAARQRVRTGLAGTFRLLPALDRLVADQEAKLIQLTGSQAAALAGLYANERLIVYGPAGSGKTMLAVATAKHLAAGGKRVLLLCFNRSLSEWLREILPRADYPTITVLTFNGLCAEWCRRAGLPFRVPDGEKERQSFFKHTAAELLSQASDIVEEKFDSVIVDEAQDFEPDWWLPIELLNIKAEEGSLYIFHDPRQNLFVNKKLYFPANAARFDLPVNCRNTRRIASYCSRVRGVEILSAALSPEGCDPKLEVIPARDRRAVAVEKQLKDWIRDGHLKPSQVAVLSPYRPDGDGCSVGNRPKLAGLPVTNDPSRWRDGEGLLVTTIRSFKGLEADAVILTDVNQPSEGVLSISDLYVASSRAKHFLTIFTTESISV